ncbi:type IV secretion system protein VirB10 [Achromobacter xylosoxidans]|uniref:type IV secretion system protein VirB10 n=2 Tax=Alcaligenes xylosoxydans xylosoxydans TaxID=85698 RepID=UPI001F064AED|nr:type IV secretion system protein VirB10 [Achromobacter xylosoxidans]MCH1986465.1 type IV secretion system protein VirB10 [Achromobacter xylosoxidans]
MKWFKRRNKRTAPIDAVAHIEEHQAAVAGRGRPDLQGAARPMAPGAKAFMWLLLLIALGLISILTWRAVVKKSVNDSQERSLRSEIRNVLPSLKLKAPEAPPPADPPPPAQTAPANPAPSKEPAAPAQTQEVDEQDPVTQRRLTSGLRADQNKTGSTGAGSTKAAASASDSGPMANKLQPLKLATARASRLANRDFLLTQGAMIDCGMDTKLVSAQAGIISCYATREVRSTSGRVALIDPGTKFTGYQQSVLAQGQPRIGVVWSRLETPSGVVINLDSPGTGSLGEAGLDGYIDTHFAERFGGAIMVSLIGDLGAWASNRGSDSNNNTVRFDNTGNAAKDAVTTVLDNTINIPPTLYRNQGGRVGIYVARDLDFSTVYALRPVPRALP